MASQLFAISPLPAGRDVTFQSLPIANDDGAKEAAGVLAKFTGGALR
jgi:hypothetical protein